MIPFLQRYDQEITRNLKDSSSSVRFPFADRLQDLMEIDQELFDELTSVALAESTMGYAEATITLQKNVAFYPLPPGFHHFLGMEKRGTDGVSVSSKLWSKSTYSGGLGVEILSAARGMRVFPPFVLENEDWVLRYLRSPGVLHYAIAEDVTETSLLSGVPGTDAGSVVVIPNYYNGMEIGLYDAGAATGQTREITFSASANGRTRFHVRHPWDPIPSGVVKYEIRPLLPFEYEGYYALEAALWETGRRRLTSADLERRRNRKLRSVRKYFSSNVMDRPPTRVLPIKVSDRGFTGEMPV